MITEVVGYVKNGDGIGWLSQKRIRKILTHEQLRQYLLNQMDIDRNYSANTLLDIVRIVEKKLKTEFKVVKLNLYF